MVPKATFRAMIALCCLVLLLALTGCGQKGPLYLPDQPVDSQQSS